MKSASKMLFLGLMALFLVTSNRGFAQEAVLLEYGSITAQTVPSFLAKEVALDQAQEDAN